MRIAIYGGSFNPPHLGHAEAARAVYSELRPDIFYIIPDNIPPHKEQDENSPTAAQRLELCRLAFADIPGVIVSDIETGREGRSYTSDTIIELRLKYSDDELLLVIGSDMLFTFPEWHEYRFILSQCTLVVASRMDGESEELSRAVQHLQEEERAKILLLSYEPYPASSTEIRKALAEGKHPAGLDEEVYRYIRENGYYLE